MNSVKKSLICTFQASQKKNEILEKKTGKTQKEQQL